MSKIGTSDGTTKGTVTYVNEIQVRAGACICTCGCVNSYLVVQYKNQHCSISYIEQQVFNSIALLRFTSSGSEMRDSTPAMWLLTCSLLRTISWTVVQESRPHWSMECWISVEDVRVRIENRI